MQMPSRHIRTNVCCHFFCSPRSYSCNNNNEDRQSCCRNQPTRMGTACGSLRCVHKQLVYISNCCANQLWILLLSTSTHPFEPVSNQYCTRPVPLYIARDAPASSCMRYRILCPVAYMRVLATGCSEWGRKFSIRFPKSPALAVDACSTSTLWCSGI